MFRNTKRMLQSILQFTGTTELYELNVSEILSQNKSFRVKLCFLSPLSPKISDHF